MARRELVLLNNAFHPAITASLLEPFCCDPASGADVRLCASFDLAGAPGAALAAEDVAALLVHGHVCVNAQLLARFPRLRCISNHGVGVDHISLADCTAAGVLVFNTPDVLTGATADCAFALLLAAARRVVEGDRFARDPATIHFPSFFFGSEVHGATVGIVGMGRIGSAIARRARGFDMRVVYHNRSRAAAEVEASLGGSEACIFAPSLDDLLALSDFVVIAAPSTAETRHLIGAAQFARMKRSAFLVNIARGSLVDQDALADALQSGAIAGAALDVTDPEPLPRDHPLLSCPNLTLTPHVGSATLTTRSKMCERSLGNLRAGLAGQAEGALNGAAFANR